MSSNRDKSSQLFSRLGINSRHCDATSQIGELEQSLQAIGQDQNVHQVSTDADDVRVQLQAISNLVSKANERNVELHQRMLTMIEHFKVLRSPSQLQQALPVLTELDGRGDVKRSRIDSSFDLFV